MYLPCGLYGWYCHDKKWLYWDLSSKRASILSLQNKRLKSIKILSLDWSYLVEVWKSYLQRNDALDILGETRMLNCKPIDSLISWIQMLNFFHMKNFLLDHNRFWRLVVELNYLSLAHQISNLLFVWWCGEPIPQFSPTTLLEHCCLNFEIY